MHADMQTTTGILELSNRQDGRLRQLDGTYVANVADPVVPANLMDRFDLRPGDRIDVELGKAGKGGGGGGNGNAQRGRGKQQSKRKKEKHNAIAPHAPRVTKILQVEGSDPQAEHSEPRHRFEDLTTIDPQPRMTLEFPGCPEVCRLIDLFCPIGFGTRGMIVSPPKAGKTTILQNMANAIARNHPDAKVIALL
ncbi:MAG: hypothetical protein MI741_05390, partial [Rhodospirillales bacterium]|nr:hypothetical protein [Rhodospirillales bacterium]